MFKKSGSLLRGTPDIPVLQQLLDKCFQQRGEKLQVYWRNTENQLFFLEVVCALKDGRPYWQLIREKSGRRTLVAEYAGHDILLVYKQISTATADAQEERAGDESGRVARTRNARAAAATWLESKSDSGSNTGSNPGSQASSAAAAAEESPWAVTPAIARQDNDSWPPVPAVRDNPDYQISPQIASGSSGFSGSSGSSGSPAASPPAPPPSSFFALHNQSRGESNQSKSEVQQAQTSSQAAIPVPVPKNLQTSPMPDIKPSPAKPVAPSPLASNLASNLAARPAPADQAPVMPVVKKDPLAHPDKMADGAIKKANKEKPAAEKSEEKKATPTADQRANQGAGSGNEGSTTGGANASSINSSSANSSSANSSSANTGSIQTPNLGKSAMPTSGNLEDTSIIKLLKQLKLAHVNARLDFPDESNCFVQLEDGKPVEAWHGELKGDSALLEILLLAGGHYAMTMGTTAANRNVKTSPEVLIEHNKNIASLLDELAQEGLTAESKFAPTNAKLSSDDFNQLASPDAPMELDKLASLFIKLDGKKTLAELNDLQVLSRPLLIQAIHHLYFANLVDIVNPPPKRPSVTPKPIDGAAIQSVMLSLRRVDTGLFIYPAFLYFLQEEFFRIYRAKGALSVLIFEMRELSAQDGLVRRVPLGSDAIADATMRMSKLKRHTDVLAHYELNDYAIILPGTGTSGAKVFANKIIKALTQTPLSGTAGRNLSFSFGGASIPEDYKDLPALLGAAELAMNQARQRGKQLVMFKELD